MAMLHKLVIMYDCRLCIIRYKDFGNAAEKLQHMDMSSGPGILLFVQKRFRIGILAVGHDTNKDIGILYFACYRIGNMGRITGPVDFDLLSGLTVNMHGCPAFFLIQLNVITELGIHQRIIPCHLALIDVFRPKKLFLLHHCASVLF